MPSHQDRVQAFDSITREEALAVRLVRRVRDELPDIPYAQLAVLRELFLLDIRRATIPGEFEVRR